jgi:hypothetical protein
VREQPTTPRYGQGAEMIEETYQGFVIKIDGPHHRPGRRAWHCWFHVFPTEVQWDEPFPFALIDSDAYIRRGPSARSGDDLMLADGRAWVHGLIDLGRIQPGGEEQLRTSEWNPAFGDEDIAEEDLRRELLTAMRRQNLVRASTSGSLTIGIDVEGIAAVLGVPAQRLRGMVSELIIEGMAEPYGDTIGSSPESGCCRITGEGLRALRAPASPSFVYVDDIDSFDKVRAIQPRDVEGLLKDGVFDVPEARVKNVLLEIIGEAYQDKDWGGERSDVFSTRIVLNGQRVPTAMLLKGPAVGKVLYPAGLGKRGDQDQRLFTEPAELFVVQFVGKIDSAVYQWVRTQATVRAQSGARTTLCVMDGADTARTFRAYGYV